MKCEMLKALRRGAVLIPAVGLSGLTPAQAGKPPPEPPMYLAGLINDYSPAHVNSVPVKGGPYEMRGRWSLELHTHLRAATFSAALNMETTDAGMVSQDDPTSRSAHTHHITMSGPLSYDTSGCPANDPANPQITWHFVVTGQAQITGNGNQAPFQVKSGPSQLQVCVGGGNDGTLEFSNVTLVLGPPANTHFGPQAIHGVITRCAWRGDRESSDCTLNW
jgi:hypothetical protein